jgi:hypothetical protein
MTAPTRPAGTKIYLRKKIIFVPTGTYSGTTPSLAILTGASALDVTNRFFSSSANPSQSTNLAKAPKRVGDGEIYEFVGETSATLGEMRYSFNQQGAALDETVKAYEKFVPGTTGFLVYRYGIDRDTDLATGQFVSSYPCECGPQLEVDEGDAEGAEGAIAQIFAQTGPKLMKKVIVA